MTNGHGTRWCEKEQKVHKTNFMTFWLARKEKQM